MAKIEDYKRILSVLASAGSTEFINNSSKEHASAMIEELFKNAKGKVCILTDHLHSDIYDRPSLKKVAAEFLSQEENEINIVVQLNQKPEDILKDNGFLLSLKRYNDKIKVFKASDGKLKGLQNHFMITKTDKGNYALRFETNITDHIATGTFNGGTNGEKLFDYFQKNIDSNNVVPIEKSSIWSQT